MNFGVVICDLDGTLCDTSHRKHFLEGKPQGDIDWEGYSLACEYDALVPGVATLLRLLDSRGIRIVLMSGRSENARELTEAWLDKHSIPRYRLYMRPRDNRVSNELMKLRWADELHDEGNVILLVIDDWNPVAENFAEYGIFTLLVKEQAGDPKTFGKRVM